MQVKNNVAEAMARASRGEAPPVGQGQGVVPSPTPSAYMDNDLRRADQIRDLLATWHQGQSTYVRMGRANQAGRLTNGQAFDENSLRSYEANLRNMSAQRQALQNSRKELPQMLQDEKGILKQEADAALESGIRKTRQNYNQRGMLYSGLREGGEQTVKGRVASALAEQTAGANRDSSLRAEAQRAQEASIGLQTARENQLRAEQIFDQSMRNQVARRQALQALGEGVGYAASSIYSSSGRTSSPAPEERRAVGGGMYMSNSVV